MNANTTHYLSLFFMALISLASGDVIDDASKSFQKAALVCVDQKTKKIVAFVSVKGEMALNEVKPPYFNLFSRLYQRRPEKYSVALVGVSKDKDFSRSILWIRDERVRVGNKLQKLDKDSIKQIKKLVKSELR